MRVFVLIFLMFFALNACETEKVIIVEKKETENDKYFETFKNIVNDVESGNADYNDYINKTFTIRATVRIIQGGGIPGVVLFLKKSKVVFYVIIHKLGEELIQIYKEGFDYNFTVEISSITGKPSYGYQIYSYAVDSEG